MTKVTEMAKMVVSWRRRGQDAATNNQRLVRAGPEETRKEPEGGTGFTEDQRTTGVCPSDIELYLEVAAAAILFQWRTLNWHELNAHF